MLKWLATQFERRRGALQARLEDSLRTKIASSPARLESAECRRKGNEFLGAGNLTEAEQCYRDGVAADPTDAVCHSNLGYVLFEQGRRSDAVAALEQAVTLDQTDFDAYYMLGNIARDRQETLRSITCYRKALQIKPDFDFCRRDLCVALAQNGKIDEAQRVMDEGPSFEVGSANYYFFKGNLHNARDQLEEANACFLRAAELSPNDTSVLWNLCTVELKSNNVFSALKTGRRMLEIEPNHAQAYSLLAVGHQTLGRYDLSVDYYRRALKLDPNDQSTHRNLLFTLTYLMDLAPQEYLQEARCLGEKIRARAVPYRSWHIPDPTESRPLRVGFVSGDLRFHPVGLFLNNVLGSLNLSKVTCIAYSSCIVEDTYSAELRRLFSAWNEVASLSDAALAQKIHNDQIDILVDLAGYSGQSRVAVFAWCPAPVQVAWLGYWASTGLDEMDYLFVDKTSVLPDEAPFYSERLWYLPETRLCFSQPPAVVQHLTAGPAPALTKGYVTFGSFQTLNKITDATLELWSRVLTQMPTARLRLQSQALKFPEFIAHTHDRLAAARIDPSRVDLFGGTGWQAYISAYRDVDVVLDTIPFPGGTTTAEALWIGVPTVTLSGTTLIGRQGESMLRCVGLDDWVAHSQQDYVRIALEKVSDLAALGALRAELRARSLASPLFDGPRFARNLETALEGIYAEKLRKISGIGGPKRSPNQ